MSQVIVTINLSKEENIKEYQTIPLQEMTDKIKKGHDAFIEWKKNIDAALKKVVLIENFLEAKCYNL